MNKISNNLILRAKFLSQNWLVMIGGFLLTQSKSKTPITRSVHSKFNCLTIVLDRTQHGSYIIQNVH